MRKATIVLVMLALAVATPASALGRITVDPNAPGTKVEATAPETDSRLDQKITYEARRQTVSAILDDLVKMTGVTLKSGYNSKDWQVRDRKMNIFAKDLPLRDLMDSIARVMKFKWSRTDQECVWCYRLYMDRKTLLDAEAQKARHDERVAQIEAEQRRRAIASYRTAYSLSEQELAKLKSEDPYSYMLASTGIAGGLGVLCGEVPGLIEALATGQKLTIHVAQLSPEGQDAMRRIVTGVNDQFFRNSPGSRLAVSENWNSEKSKVVVNPFPDSDGPPVVGRFNLCWDADSDMAEQMTLFDPSSSVARVMGQATVDSWDGKGSFDELLAARESEMNDPGTAESAGEPLTEHPEEPALLKKARVQPKSNLLQDVQCALAESSGFTIVADSFGRTECFGGVPKDEVEIGKLLDKVARSSFYNWAKNGPVIEFRSRYWFRLRSAQIPEARIEPWRKAFKKNYTLDIAELAQIAGLTRLQISVNIDQDEVLSCTAAPQPGSLPASLAVLLAFKQDVLRAYGAFTEDERRALFSPPGLRLSELSPDARAAVEKMVGGRSPRYLETPDAGVMISAKRSQKGKQFEYTFTVTTSEGLEPIVWAFTTPLYEPPKKDEPRDKPQSQQGK